MRLQQPLPPPLRQGDRVQLVAASSALEATERLEAGIQLLRSWGLDVGEPTALVGRQWGYLAGRDDERASDLGHNEPQDQQAPLLACVRGGLGIGTIVASRWLTCQ